MDLSGHEGDVPIPISSTFASGHVHPPNHSTAHDIPAALHHYHPSNGPSPPPLSTAAATTTTTATEDHHQHHNSNSTHSTKKRVVAKYRECLKNHAASIGGNATDGCGEFMASGGEGTLEALKCSACGCHRNFHRKEPEGEPCDCFHPFKGRRLVAGDRKGLLISGPDAFGYGHADSGLFPRPAPHHMIMPLGMLHTSESDEMDGAMARPSIVKKRFRTKFTPEQKEKMLSFAERVGWRLQRQEEGVVQQFCQEIGVKRRVLKVWMHNNKHVLAKKNSVPPEESFHGQS